MAQKRKYQVGAFNTISLVDLLTGALGAIIALFAIIPKIQLSELMETKGDRMTISVSYDLVDRYLWGSIPDSMKQYSKKLGDTVQMVVDHHGRIPRDTVYYENYPTYTNTNPSGGTPKKPEIPVPKSEVTGDCLLSIVIADVNCDDKGTIRPTDDTFTALFTINSAHAGKMGWEATLDDKPLNVGDYGQAYKIGPLSIGSKPYRLKVSDKEKSSCVITTQISSPPPCSDTPPPPKPPAPDIAGKRVISLQWENMGEVDLNLILKKDRITCNGRTSKTPFAEHTTEIGIQEYIRIQGRMRNGTRQEPPAGTYEIYVHNRKDKGPLVKGTVKIALRDATNNALVNKAI